LASYRFCRPDDIPLLVEAVNRCYLVHFPGSTSLTIEGFRTLMKELDVWPSNCMVALSGDDPAAILIGTKRETEVLVMWIGVHSDFQRQGHALHIVTSLSQKLAVLGPSRLIAEPALDLPGASELFAAAGFERELLLEDYSRTDEAALEPVPDGPIFPATYHDLADAELLSHDENRAWIRSPASLRASSANLEARAIGTPLGLDAFLLFRENPDLGTLDVLSAGCRDRECESPYLELLLRDLVTRSNQPIRLPKLRQGEFPPAVLERLGFTTSRSFERVAMSATPG
jgi:ribosomal protein S18 acetylase RimI-like enzyme